MRTLKEIYEVLTEMGRESIFVQEGETPSDNEDNIQSWFLSIKSLGNNFKFFVYNEYLKFKICNQKSNSKNNSEDKKKMLMIYKI